MLYKPPCIGHIGWPAPGDGGWGLVPGRLTGPGPDVFSHYWAFEGLHISMIVLHWDWTFNKMNVTVFGYTGTGIYQCLYKWFQEMKRKERNSFNNVSAYPNNLSFYDLSDTQWRDPKETSYILFPFKKLLSIISLKMMMLNGVRQ